MVDASTKPGIYPLAWLVIALLAMFGLNQWWPVASMVSYPTNWLGLLLALPGLGIVLYAGFSFLKAKTGLLPFSEATHLVTGGFFRFTRNPMYLGMVTFLLGLAVILGSVSALIPVVVFAWIIDRRFIRNEEQFLIETFGDEYLAYMQQVRRWI